MENKKKLGRPRQYETVEEYRNACKERSAARHERLRGEELARKYIDYLVKHPQHHPKIIEILPIIYNQNTQLNVQ